MNDADSNLWEREVRECFWILTVCQLLFYIFANVISLNLYNFSEKGIEVK